MVEADKPQFREIMEEVAANFNADLTKPLARLWWRTLEKVSIQDFQRAMDYIVRNRPYTGSMPTLSDVRDALMGGSVEDQAQVEAGKVWEAVCSVGPYDGVCFDDPVTQAVIVLHFNGWTELCSTLTMDQQKWFIKDFSKAYAAFKRQGIKRGGVLGGLGDIQRVVLIGNKDRAEQVKKLTNENQKLIHKPSGALVDQIAAQKSLPETTGNGRDQSEVKRSLTSEG